MKIILFIKIFVMSIFNFFLNYALSADNEVGTYALFKIKEDKNEVLYKINTKTGQVWCYTESLILKAEDMKDLSDKEKEGLNKIINQADKQKQHVYTLPYWVPTSEKPENRYIIR